MRLSFLSLTTTLCLTSALTAALPTPPHTPNSTPTLSPRHAAEWSYSVRGTAIKLIGTTGVTIGTTIFSALISAAADFLTDAVGAYGGDDALIPHGQFRYTDHDTHAMIHLQNANNHQLTWKVVTAAVDSLINVPELGQKYETEFKIFDGVNQVGTGSLYMVTA